MKMNNALISLALAALLFASPRANADTVTLANGDRLTGKVLRLGADRLELQTDYAGKLEIKRTEVAAIRTDGDVRVMLKGEAGIGPARGELPLPRIAFVNPTPEQSGIGAAYRGRVSLSSAWAHGNSANSNTAVDAFLGARARRYRWALEMHANQASESGAETASHWLAQGNYDRFVAPKRFFYGRTSLERDRYGGIDLRTTLGGGYGVQLLDDARTRLSLRGGLEAVSLKPLEGPTEHHPAVGWGVRYSWKVLASRAEVFHEQDGYWNLEDSADVTLRTRTGLRIPLADGLTCNAQVNVDWDHEPEPGRRATDSTLVLGLGYAW